MSHHERALVNDLQSVSKKLSETRSRIGLKSMKINVGSPKKRYREKSVTDKKHYRKETVTEKNVTHKHSLTIFTNSSPRWRALNKDISNTCFDIKRRDGLRNAYWDPPRRVPRGPSGVCDHAAPDASQKVGKIYKRACIFIGSEASYTEASEAHCRN